MFLSLHGEANPYDSTVLRLGQLRKHLCFNNLPIKQTGYYTNKEENQSYENKRVTPPHTFDKLSMTLSTAEWVIF